MAGPATKSIADDLGCRPTGHARRAGRAPHASLSEAIKGAGVVALGRAIDVSNRRPTPRPAASSR